MCSFRRAYFPRPARQNNLFSSRDIPKRFFLNKSNHLRIYSSIFLGFLNKTNMDCYIQIISQFSIYFYIPTNSIPISGS